MTKRIISIILIMVGLTYTVQAQDTQGFFINDHQPKKAIVPAHQKIKAITDLAGVHVTLKLGDSIATMSKYLFGNNTNPYMTQIVNQPALMSQLQLLSPNVLRFPGGNISNEYFWDKAPGERPSDVPDTILFADKRQPRKARSWVGKDDSPQSLSLDHYYQLLQQTNSVGTICVNAGYARYGTGAHPIANAAHYAAEWVRYDKGRTRFWEVGNEDYGVWQAGYKIDTHRNRDGQPEITNGQLYGKIFKAFRDSMRAAARAIGSEIYVGATLVEMPKNNKWDTEVAQNWNSDFFELAGNAADFFVVHSYYTPYNKNADPRTILNSGTTITDSIIQYLQFVTQAHHLSLKPVALTEWNIFSTGSKQMTSYISGMHAAIVLGELAKQKYGMACRWDLANGYNNGNDHGLFNTGDEPGMPKWSARPAFYYLYYFQRFFGDKVVAASADDPNVLVYASVFSDGKKGVVLINKDTLAKTVSIHLPDAKPKAQWYAYTLTGGNDNGLFSQQVWINGIAPSLPAGGPEHFEKIKAQSTEFSDDVKTILPPMAVQYLLIE